MFHGHLDCFQEPPLESRPNTKLGDHGTPNTHNRWLVIFYHVWGPTWIKIHSNSIWLRTRSWITSRYTWESLTYMILEVCWDGLWTLSFGLSQFHGHDSWLLAHVWSGLSIIMRGSLIFILIFLARREWPRVLHSLQLGNDGSRRIKFGSLKSNKHGLS